MFPSSDFSTYDFIPSSVKIGRRIFQKGLEADLARAHSLMGKMSGAHFGLVFEPFAHFVLAGGGSFNIRNLKDDVTEDLELPEQTTKNIANSELPDLSVVENVYYVPTDPTFAVVDSWNSRSMYQVTVGITHPIKSGSKQFKALKNKVPNRIIFVVPKPQAAGFKLQNLVLSNGTKPANGGGPQGGWNDIEQFVLGLEV
jgi:hypothetical protein